MKRREFFGAVAAGVSAGVAGAVASGVDAEQPPYIDLRFSDGEKHLIAFGPLWYWCPISEEWTLIPTESGVK